MGKKTDKTTKAEKTKEQEQNKKETSKKPKIDGKWYKPAKFLWKFPLATGIKIIAAIMIIVMFICIIVVAANAAIVMAKYDTASVIVINALSFIFTELIFSVLMIIIHILLLVSSKWKNLKKKVNLITSWLATQAVWIIHKACLMCISMFLFLKVIHIGVWILIFILAILALVILVYFWIVVYSYWSSLKLPNTQQGGQSKESSGKKSAPKKGSSPGATSRASPRGSPRSSPRSSPHRQNLIDEPTPQP